MSASDEKVKHGQGSLTMIAISCRCCRCCGSGADVGEGRGEAWRELTDPERVTPATGFGPRRGRISDLEREPISPWNVVEEPHKLIR